jgi:hypothetical protein
MSTNVVNQVAFLRTSREFPEELRQLSVETNKSYIDIAAAVNSRVIGIYPTTRSAITGESWFLNNNQRQQTLRQVYTFTTTASITHGIPITNPSQFTNCFGSYTNGTNSFGLIFGTSVAIAGQISFYLTSTQIIFLVGAGAPALTSGTIVIQWLSSV